LISKKIISGCVFVKAPIRQIPETRAGLITVAFSGGVDSPAEFFIFDIIYFAKSVPWILNAVHLAATTAVVL